MGDLVDLSDAPSRWFADTRGRSLKATWHPEGGLVVLSLWQEDRCIGTFRLSAADAAELGRLLDRASDVNDRDRQVAATQEADTG